MKHIILTTLAATWILIGCSDNTNSSTKNTGPCTNYDNQTLCSAAKYNNSGCYWAAPAAGAAGPTGCIAVSDCGQPTTKSACEASSQSNTKCTWDGSACYLNIKADTTSKCSMFSDQTSCQSSSTFEGVCYWTGTACAAATACSNIKDEATCSGSTVASKACAWTPGTTACQVNNPARCTLSLTTEKNLFGVDTQPFCCAGTDNTCTDMDPTCGQSISGECYEQSSFSCTLSTKTAAACCVDSSDCTSTNANCTFVATAGSCS